MSTTTYIGAWTLTRGSDVDAVEEARLAASSGFTMPNILVWHSLILPDKADSLRSFVDRISVRIGRVPERDPDVEKELLHLFGNLTDFLLTRRETEGLPCSIRDEDMVTLFRNTLGVSVVEINRRGREADQRALEEPSQVVSEPPGADDSNIDGAQR